MAELGVAMGQFPRAPQAASWAKRSPGQHVRAGKRDAATIGKGNQGLRSTLIPAAHAAVKVKDSSLAACSHRLVARRRVKTAIVAVAHTRLTLAYTRLRQREPSQERGAAAVDECCKDQILHRMQPRCAQLGDTVHLEPITSMAAWRPRTGIFSSGEERFIRVAWSWQGVRVGTMAAIFGTVGIVPYLVGLGD